MVFLWISFIYNCVCVVDGNEAATSGGEDGSGGAGGSGAGGVTSDGINPEFEHDSGLSGANNQN